jgi:hypothetical protein
VLVALCFVLEGDDLGHSETGWHLVQYGDRLAYHYFIRYSRPVFSPFVTYKWSARQLQSRKVVAGAGGRESSTFNRELQPTTSTNDCSFVHHSEFGRQ